MTDIVKNWPEQNESTRSLRIRTSSCLNSYDASGLCCEGATWKSRGAPIIIARARGSVAARRDRLGDGQHRVGRHCRGNRGVDGGAWDLHGDGGAFRKQLLTYLGYRPEKRWLGAQRCETQFFCE